MKVLRKLKVELQYDPAIPLLGIYPDETIIQKDTCTPVFTAAVFTTAKTWEQPTKEYYSVIKKEQNNAIYSNMDAIRDYYAK